MTSLSKQEALNKIEELKKFVEGYNKNNWQRLDFDELKWNNVPDDQLGYIYQWSPKDSLKCNWWTYMERKKYDYYHKEYDGYHCIFRKPKED